MKTIQEWLSEGLTADHYKLISKYGLSCNWDKTKVQSLSSALMGSTLWRNTEEGLDFWVSIYKDIRENRYIKHSNNIFLKL